MANIYTNSPQDRYLRAASGGKTVILKDNRGAWHSFYVLTQFFVDGVIHPAFVVESASGTKYVNEIYVGQHLVSEYASGKYTTEAGMMPATRMTFSAAQTAAKAMGPGWHVMTKAEHAAVCYHSQKILNSEIKCGDADADRHNIRGSVAEGKDYFAQNDASGIGGFNAAQPQGTVGSADQRTKTGSLGPCSSHTKQAAGVYDLGGNIREFVTGIVLRNNRIYCETTNYYTKDTTHTALTAQDIYILTNAGALEYTTLGNTGTGGILREDRTPSLHANSSTAIDAIATQLMLTFQGNTGSSPSNVDVARGIDSTSQGMHGEFTATSDQASTNHFFAVGGCNKQTYTERQGIAQYQTVDGTASNNIGFRVVFIP